MKLSLTGMGTTKLNNIDEMYPGQSILLQTGQLVQYGAGLFGYNTIPLLLRRKIESIIVDTLNAHGCIEVLLPTLQPDTIWKNSGRYDHYVQDGTMLITESNKGTFCLAPTGEEAMLEFAKEYGITWQTEKLFLTAQIQISNFHTLQTRDSAQEEELMRASEEVIVNFENLICVTINERETLLEALFQHIKPAFYRMKYHYHIEQSILDMVLPQYASLHAIVRKSIGPVEKLVGVEVPDEELVYITALFGAWLRREGILELAPEAKKRAVVVCANGISVSNFLYFTLKELFPEIDFIACLSMRDFATYDETKFDIVFTMVRLETAKTQFVVKPFLDEISKMKFRDKVMGELVGIVPRKLDVSTLLDVVRKYADIKDEEALKREFAAALNPETEEEKSDNVSTKFQIGLKDVLVEETVQVLDHVLPWEDAIQTVAKPLLDRGDITERYVQKAIDNIKADKPFIMIADGVIIAHAGVDDGAKRVCLSLLTMPERTDVYGYMEADVVIMIGTPDPTKHLEVLEQLNHIIEDKKSLQLLKKAKKPEDIIKLIQKREKEKKKC